MDEIICPECGRPNLVEAEKCWYCQVVLTKNSNDSPPDENLPDFEITDIPDNSRHEETPEENVPEWLKRVRALRKADQPEEEAISQWQQEKLFKGQVDAEPRREKYADEFSHQVRQTDPTEAPKPAALPEQPELEPIPDAADQVVMEKPEDEIFKNEPDQTDGELPEGFLPLNN